MIELPERIVNKLKEFPDSTDSCWIWNAALGNGVPKIMDIFTKNAVNVRQLIFRQVSTIPWKPRAGGWCKNILCVNPWHMDPYCNNIKKQSRKGRLFPVWHKGSTFKCGHPVKAANSHVSRSRKNGTSFKHCAICFWRYLGDYYGVDYSEKIAFIQKALAENPNESVTLPRHPYTKKKI